MLPPVPTLPTNLSHITRKLSRLDPVKLNGRVTQMIGLVIEATGPTAPVGELCEIRSGRSQPPMAAEVVGVRDAGDGNARVLLMPLGDVAGIRPGAEVVSTGDQQTVAVGPGLLGRVLDGLGRPMDGKGPLTDIEAHRSVNAAPPDPLGRARITEPLPLGVRVLYQLRRYT